MTKKDYQAIARAIYTACDSGKDNRIVTDVVSNIADVLAADSPRFDRERFVEACETGRCKGMPR